MVVSRLTPRDFPLIADRDPTGSEVMRQLVAMNDNNLKAR
jgi:hypothetical protein